MSDARIRELRRNLRDVTDLARLDEELRRVGDGPYELVAKVYVQYLMCRHSTPPIYGIWYAEFPAGRGYPNPLQAERRDWRWVFLPGVEFPSSGGSVVDLAVQRSREYGTGAVIESTP